VSQRLISGYAVLWQLESNPISPAARCGAPFIESYQCGAFASALAARPTIEARVNHEPSLAFGSTADGLLSVHEDALGLRVAILLPHERDMGYALAYELRGPVRGFSIGFRAGEDDCVWTETADGKPKRIIHRAELTEVSILTAVHNPALKTVTFTERMIDNVEAKLLQGSNRSAWHGTGDECMARAQLEIHRAQVALLTHEIEASVG